MMSVFRRPYRSEIQAITPRPVPLMMALRLIASATIPPAKPISLPKGTCMAMPKMLMPAVHSRTNHINGRMPVLIASIGVNCLAGGGVLAQGAANPRVLVDLQRVDVRGPPVLRRILEKEAADRDQCGEEDADREQDALVVGQIHVIGEQEDEGHRPVGEATVDETGLTALAFGIPLTHHVDAGGVHETGRASAEEPEAQVREEDV